MKVIYDPHKREKPRKGDLRNCVMEANDWVPGMYVSQMYSGTKWETILTPEQQPFFLLARKFDALAETVRTLSEKIEELDTIKADDDYRGG